MSRDSTYSAQARGSADAYAAYYAGMDRSMQQKVALTTAYFPVRGVLADMGCGSGAGSFDLASLHEELHVIGVDVAPMAVAHAAATYKRPNLEYRLGDIAEPIFAPESLDGFLNSSVFHHLTSFNGFSLDAVRRSLDSQTAALKPGGVLIIRDFIVPPGPEMVLLDLPNRDGRPEDDGGQETELSTAALFERFAHRFRSSQNPDRPVPYTRIGMVRPGWVRYKLHHRAASEFVLRKDYREHFDAEIREEYTYFDQAAFEEELRARELRILISVELHNPWIIENRFRGRFFLYDLNEKPLPYPPTNYLIVGEKVRRGAGVAFLTQTFSSETQSPHGEPQFLRLSVYEHRETGQRVELVERPNPVIDFVPWFRNHPDGRVFVLAKQGYPRPLVTESSSPNLDGAHVAGYLTETITAASPAESLSQEGLIHLLTTRTNFSKECVRGLTDGLRYFTSPGGVNERVNAYLVELFAARAPSLLTLREEVANYTAFSSAGLVRPLLCTQLLRAAEVGGLLDARLELNVYHLLTQLGEALGPWIGAELALRDQESPPAGCLGGDDEVAAVLALQAGAAFLPSASQKTNFLEVRTAEITEINAQAESLAKTKLEYVIPRSLSTNTLSVLPVLRVRGEVFVGLELRDLPAVQVFSGHSRFVTNPAWRLPKAIVNLNQAEAFLTQQLAMQFGARLLRAWPLGGKYYPAPGVTKEVVYPMVAELDGASIQHTSLSFVPLRALLSQRCAIEDGHLLIGLFRLAHAASVLS